MSKAKYLSKNNRRLTYSRTLSDSSTINSSSVRIVMLFSIVFNAIAFLTVIAIYPPAWYTNDDYRMMTIVSGVYTGTPSADIIFMRYPVGFLLSWLYTLTTAIPWYGLFTMVCMFIPCCIFCHYIVKKAYLKNHTLFGVCIYILAFIFLIRKYICLPQFTLTSAFMGVGAIVLILEMPAQKNIKHIILAAICAVFSFSIRSKAFYMLLPLIALIIIVRLIDEKGTKIWKPMVAVCVITTVLCGMVYAVDYAAWNRSEEYQEYRQFNIARSSVYDYGSIPGYYSNISFYVSNGISEVTYRALSTRYLDIDDSVDTETLETIGNYIQEIRSNSGNFIERLEEAFEATIEYWFDSEDSIVKYSSLFVFVLLAASITMSLKKKKYNIIFPAAVAGFILESVAFKFSGRLIVRIVDVLLLVAGIVGCLAIMDMLDIKETSFKRQFTNIIKSKKRFIYATIAIFSICAVTFSSIISLNYELEIKYKSVAITTNARMSTLENYAETHPNSFFFCDSQNFISCTDYVFKTYDEGEILNHDSLGSWNVHSPTYYERNAKYGFTSSADAFTSDDCDVYFVTTSSLKMGMTKTLKDKYNKKLKLVDSVDADNYILYIYMVVDDD